MIDRLFFGGRDDAGRDNGESLAQDRHQLVMDVLGTSLPWYSLVEIAQQNDWAVERTPAKEAVQAVEIP